MDVELIVRLRVGNRPEGIAMSDWSNDAARRIQRKRDDARIKSEKALQEDKLLNLNSSALWQQLRDLLIQMSNDFNSEPGFQDALLLDKKNSAELRIEYSEADAKLCASFDAERQSIILSGNLTGVYKFKVIPGTRDVSIVDSNGMSAPPHEIAKKAMDKLL